MINLTIPISENEISQLNSGDFVLLNGIMITGRDVAHKYIVKNYPEEIKKYLNNGVIYHCGPVVSKVNGVWKFVAAGPTTSIREEPYEFDVIKHYGLKGVIGKGGMGEKTKNALVEHKAVYFHAVGGTAVTLANCVKKVVDVLYLEEFGVPEAMWVIEVENFPVIVTMDTKGISLHDEVFKNSKELSEKIIKEM